MKKNLGVSGSRGMKTRYRNILSGENKNEEKDISCPRCLVLKFERE